MTDHCSYRWERRTRGKRYVNARGYCKRKATGKCLCCSVHCTNWSNDPTYCEHPARRRKTTFFPGPGEYMGTTYGDGY
jgi:hypothetical protein